MLKISFFGASVTQQHDGYAKQFEILNPGVSCSIFGYGARHLKDAGICYLDKVLSERSHFVVIDWFSTGYIKIDNLEKIKIYINTIVYKCIKNNSRPIFLFLPQMDDVTEIYQLIKIYLELLKIPFIDICEYVSDKKIVLRDTVHTNFNGSLFYAKIITNFINANCNNYPNVVNLPAENRYTNIQTLDINKRISRQISFEGSCEIIGVSQTVGPYSGYVLIDNFLYNLWDRWCYYEREMIHFEFVVNGKRNLSVLDYDFDRSACKILQDWPREKILNLIQVFYIGDNLSVVDAV